MRTRRVGPAHSRLYVSFVASFVLYFFQVMQGSRRGGPTITARARPGLDKGYISLEKPLPWPFGPHVAVYK